MPTCLHFSPPIFPPFPFSPLISPLPPLPPPPPAGNNASSGPNSGGGNADAVIAKARKFEQGNDYARAIEAYLSLTAADSPNPDTLQQCWEQAASLAQSYQRHRLHDVVGIVSQRLQEIQRFAAAGELHESVDDVQGGWVNRQRVWTRRAGLVWESVDGT